MGMLQEQLAIQSRNISLVVQPGRARGGLQPEVEFKVLEGEFAEDVEWKKRVRRLRDQLPILMCETVSCEQRQNIVEQWNHMHIGGSRSKARGEEGAAESEVEEVHGGEGVVGDEYVRK